MEIMEKPDVYILEITIPNIKENRLNIEINEEGISITGQVVQRVKRKDPDGHFIRAQEMRHNVSRQFPLPPGADYEDALIENQENKIRIILKKKT